MNCREFQLHINDFLTGKIKDNDILSDFIEHALGCQECYEELELYYTLQVGLELVDKDASVSFDFAGELSRMIEEYDEGLYVSKRVAFLSKWIHLVAIVVSYFTLFMCILELIKII